MNRPAITIGATLTIAGAIFLVWSPAGDGLPSCPDLIAAGVALPDCHPAKLTATLRLDAVGVEILRDAGFTLAREHQRHVYADTLVLIWDGGVMPPLLQRAGADENGSVHVQVVGSASVAPCDALCARPFPLQLRNPPCWVPSCWDDAGVWRDDAVVDCQRSDALGVRWAGCNVIEPPASAIGAACVPAVCVVSDRGDTL